MSNIKHYLVIFLAIVPPITCFVFGAISVLGNGIQPPSWVVWACCTVTLELAGAFLLQCYARDLDKELLKQEELLKKKIKAKA